MRYKIETERENLFDVNMVIAMRVRVEGKLLFEDLEKAFYKAVASYEILNSRVVIEENGKRISTKKVVEKLNEQQDRHY